MSIETAKMLICSTGMISKSTASLLEMQTDDVPVCFNKGEFGWMIHVPEAPFGSSCMEDQDPHTCPKELVALLNVARAEGCDWIMLDCDAGAIDGLESFDW